MNSTNLTLEQRIADANRTVKLREAQMLAAALARDEGDIAQDDWDGFAARYAAAVREWRALQYHHMANKPALAETGRGGTWVQR